MNKYILALALLNIFSGHAKAGLPSEDPIVNKLREEFKSSREVTNADIENKSYQCVSFRTGWSDFSQVAYSSKLSFRAFNGFLQASFIGYTFDDRMYLGNGRELQNNGNLRRSPNTSYTSAFRINSKGELIMEWSITPTDEVDVRKLKLEPLADYPYADMKVASYDLCLETK